MISVSGLCSLDWTSTTTTVTLSLPPLELASSTSSLAASLGSGKRDKMAAIWSSEASRGSPSLQSKYLSLFFGGDLDDVHVDRGLNAQRSGEDVTLGVYGRLRLAYLAFVDQFLDQAVVHRDLRERLVPVQVETRVTDVGHRQPARPVIVFDHRQCHQRGPHAEHLPVGPGLLPNGAVGRLRGALQRRGRALVAGFEGGVQGLDSGKGGNLAGGVTTHPVRHRVQAGRHQQLVLVVGADEANVGGGTDHQARHLRSSSTVRPT